MATVKKKSMGTVASLAPKKHNKKGKAHKSVGPKVAPKSKYRGQGR